MSETRALRDRLEQTQAELRRAKEHLEKLRAHQARERESLQQQLEEARRQVAGLRGRLQELESPRPEPLPAPDAAPPKPASVERSASALVALARSPASLESSLPTLSRLLKLAPVDVRFRLAMMLPAVMVRLPLSQAEELRTSLRAEGFLAVSYEVVPQWANGWLSVKRFGLEEQGLSLEGTQGQSAQVRFADLRLMVRGRRTSTQVEKKEEVEYDYTSRGRRHSARVIKTVEEKREQVENFLWVLGKGVRAAFTQSTQFMGLGGQLAPTVHENLQRLMGEVRRRATHVVVDERLVQMPRFSMPLVDPGRSQEIFAELLFRAVDEGLWR